MPESKVYTVYNIHDSVLAASVHMCLCFYVYALMHVHKESIKNWLS
jgi:hypothetical protein